MQLQRQQMIGINIMFLFGILCEMKHCVEWNLNCDDNILNVV